MKEPVTKGMSGAEKYLATAMDGRKYLLRLSQIEQYERKSAEYGMMEIACKNGVNVSKPFEFGLYQNERIYQLTQWCAMALYAAYGVLSALCECGGGESERAYALKKIQSLAQRLSVYTPV